MLKDSLPVAVNVLRERLQWLNGYRAVPSTLDTRDKLAESIEYLEQQIAAGVPLSKLEDRADFQENLHG